MWSRLSSALKSKEDTGNDQDHPDAACRSPPDPFRVDATAYYTHSSPPTPPVGAHSRTASREEDIIWSLRTQLALQQEMCAQFEIDLGARDELVEALTLRLDTSEKENDKRKNMIRSWQKKAADLERLCRRLEEQVDHSRRESMERSIMDEASGEALRQLHRHISRLEREKTDIETERNALAQTVADAEAETTRLREQLGNVDGASEEAARRLRHQVVQLEEEKTNVEGERDILAQALERADAELANLRCEISATEEANAEALRDLRTQMFRLEQEKTDLQAERNALAQAGVNADEEALKLREELHASRETNSEVLRTLQDQISQMEQERSHFKSELDSLAQAKAEAEVKSVGLTEELAASNEANREALRRLHDQISQLERDKGEVETERDDVSSEIARLRAHIQQLQKDSAVMEVSIVQLNKQLDQNKEDIDGLNIALESKQLELELVKRKHGVRGAVVSTSGRTISITSNAGKSAPSSAASRASSVVPRTSSPVLPKAPSTLGRAANTARQPVGSAIRRASSSSTEFKTKLPSRRLSIATSPSEADEKENTVTPVPVKQPRRTMVPT